jgi:NAD(P)-dependent dehydrogenase (short-subunit alcohol dehydrogenase family)
VRPVEQSTILVTGATDGLGRRVAHDLAAQGATVLVHGRRRERGEQVLDELPATAGGERLALHLADLSSLAEVERLAEEVAGAHDRLDVLVNNAGIGLVGPSAGRELSADGHELHLAVNYLSQFLLTARLLPLLERSAPARIVNVASIGQAAIDFDDPMLERGYDGFRAYARSKLAQVMFTFSLAERLPADRVTVNCLHPATLMDTKMARAFGRPRTTIEEGARATERLITDPALDGVSGRYFDGLEESTADPQAYDETARRALWKLSRELTGADPGA